MAKLKSPVPLLILGDTDVGWRVFDMAAELTSLGQDDRLRFTIYDHDPLPLSWEGGHQRVQASWDGGKNRLDGKAHVVDWRVDNGGQHITVEGRFMRIEEPTSDA